jgi:hypothetical protein
VTSEPKDNTHARQDNLYDNWALMNMHCTQPVVGQGRDRKTHVGKLKDDDYSAQNAEHLLIYAREIAREPIKAFENIS